MFSIENHKGNFKNVCDLENLAFLLKHMLTFNDYMATVEYFKLAVQ